MLRYILMKILAYKTIAQEYVCVHKIYFIYIVVDVCVCVFVYTYVCLWHGERWR